jgi:hypothetical protein
MKKTQQPDRENLRTAPEKDLTLAQGGQHVDNPGQTAMTDGPG